MNFSNILNEIAKADPEVFEKTSERRDVIKNWTRKIALTALPFALGGLFKKAYGKTTDIIADTLNFALTLEYLERNFYKQALDNNALVAFIPSGAPLGAIQKIYQHEASHVTFLISAIQGAGGTPIAEPNFDFTAGGAFVGSTSNYATFLAVAQTFEDTGVRAYKGQAGFLMTSNEVLTAALNIHSVEARHASHIRQMRAGQGANVKPWITGKDTGGIGSAVQASYDGEELTVQAGADISGFVNAAAASESFDEPLTKAQVEAIVAPFIL